MNTLKHLSGLRLEQSIAVIAESANVTYAVAQHINEVTNQCPQMCLGLLWDY